MIFDTKDYLLIVISFAVGVIANLWTPVLSRVFQRQKLAFVESNKNRALAKYLLIKKLHLGEMDRSLFFIGKQMEMVMLMGTAISGIVVAFASVRSWPTWSLIVFISGGILIFWGYGLLFSASLFRTRIDNFTEYRAAVEKKYRPLPDTDELVPPAASQ